jgi:Rod binding domain-containing protein
MAAFSALAGQTGPAALNALALSSRNLTAPNALTSSGRAASDPKAKAHEKAVDFESVFLNSMFSQMFTGIDGDGPFGGKGAVGVWRSFLSEEYAKSFAKAGGIGIADHVYRALIAQQEVAAK